MTNHDLPAFRLFICKMDFVIARFLETVINKSLDRFWCLGKLFGGRFYVP